MSNQTNLFRVGGVYRCIDGAVVRLRYVPFWSEMEVMAQAVDVDDSYERGARRLADGIYPYTNNENYGGNLLPGELTLVNGEWVSMTPTLDKMEAEKKSSEWDQIGAAAESLAQAVYGVDLDTPRPALDWDKKADTDRFPGFVVSDKNTQDQPKQLLRAEQLCADFDGLVMKVR